jgi:membrane protease YdiL (CAAX protease family)
VFVEETVIKGLLFSLPFFLLPIQDKNPMKALGITSNNFFQSVYLGIILGLILGLVGQAGNFIRHQTILFSGFNVTSANIGAFLILSLITAFWEQVLFSGFFIYQIARISNNEMIQVTVAGLLFSFIHLPALLLVQHADVNQLTLSLGLLFTLGMGCAILRLRLNNLIAPIMAHALWGVTIFLYR